MAQRALTKRIIPVHVLTASYRIAGTAKVSNSGLSGLMTDSTSQFMTIMDASLGRKWLGRRNDIAGEHR